MCGVSIFAYGASAESTGYGTITEIQARAWGLHVNTSFSGGAKHGCNVEPGDTYMYDFRYDNALNSPGGKTEVSMLLTAYASQTPIAFHIYACNSDGTRPIVGYIRMKREI